MSILSNRPRPQYPGSRVPLALLTSPFQIGVAAASALVGLGIIVSTLFPVVVIFSLLQTLVPAPIVVTWAAFLFLGGTGVTVSTFLREQTPPRAVALEVPSLALLGTAWLVYASVPVFAHALLASLPIGLCVAAACYLRILGIIIAARVTRKVMTTLTEDA